MPSDFELKKYFAALLKLLSLRRDDNASFFAERHRVLVTIAEKLHRLQCAFDDVALAGTTVVR